MGSGTLVTDSFNEGVRLATQNDVRNILFLLKPYFKDKTILQMSRNEIIEIKGFSESFFFRLFLPI